MYVIVTENSTSSLSLGLFDNFNFSLVVYMLNILLTFVHLCRVLDLLGSLRKAQFVNFLTNMDQMLCCRIRLDL